MELIIGDHNWRDYIDPVVIVDDEHKAKGLIPRDYTTHPAGCYASARATDVPVIPRSEWAERIRDMEATKSRISDVLMTGNAGQKIPSLDQNGQGFCWCYSTTGAVTALRALMGLPYVRLSAHAVACKIKNFRDEGGWGALSLDYITSNGVPSVEFWAEKSMSRQYDTQATWANAALHKAVESWVDLSVDPYDRKMTFDQVMSLLLVRNPVVTDFNWWSHSVHAVDPVNGSTQMSETRVESGKLATLQEFEQIWGMGADTGGYSLRIRNSWTDSWGTNGFGILTGSKAIPDGAVAPRTTTPSLV